MSEKIKLQVMIEMDFDVTPGEWQSRTEMVNSSTPKILDTVEEIVDDLRYLGEHESIDDLMDLAKFANVVYIKRMP